MSVEAFSWALTVPVGGNQKVILLGLANHAHPDGTEAYPALDTLATYAHCDRSTARRNVRKLVVEGWAIEDGTGPKGQTKYRLPLTREAGSKTPPRGETGGVAPAPAGGGKTPREGVAPMPPEPSIEPKEPSTERNAGEQASAQGCVHRLPDDLPEHLHDAAIAAGRVLYRAAKAKGQTRPVMLEAVGRAVGQTATKDHLEVAGAVEHWLCWGNGQKVRCADVVARFRQFLADAPDVRLPSGSPLGEPVTAANVHPIRQSNGKPSHDQLLAELRAVNPRLQAEGTNQLPVGALNA